MADGDAVRLGNVEERGDGDFAATVFEAAVILSVGFLVVVIRVELTEPVEELATFFAQL